MRTAVLAAATAAVVLAVSGARGRAQEAAAPAPGLNTFRLLTFAVGTSGPRLGSTVGNGAQDVVDVHNAIRYLRSSGALAGRILPPIPMDMLALIEAGPESARALKGIHSMITAARASGKFTDGTGANRIFHPEASITYLPPILNPTKIIGLAGNYIRAADGKPGAYDFVEYPSAFLKPPTSMTGHKTEINLEGLLTTGVHEPEMALIIGKRAVNVSEADAMDYVMGYTILNDVSSRDLKQGAHNTQGSTVGKGLDTFSPTGPYITLKEDVPNPHNLDIVGIVNGKPWPIPNASTRFITWTMQQHVAYFSERFTLEPGDIIATGVPGPVMTFKEGDVVELRIGHLGTLKNTVVSKPVPGHRIFPPRDSKQDPRTRPSS